MEEYTQITIDQWLSWKEDVRRKLNETAQNFVYIGYRLKQIRDSGMYDGKKDIFEFAQDEYGLSKSTVSRFMAINDKYSEDGNSLELRDEFKGLSSSKLSEMLTLPDEQLELITEQTTVSTIRELKAFNKEAEEMQIAGLSSENQHFPVATSQQTEEILTDGEEELTEGSAEGNAAAVVEAQETRLGNGILEEKTPNEQKETENADAPSKNQGFEAVATSQQTEEDKNQNQSNLVLRTELDEEWPPLERCIIDYFKDKKELFDKVVDKIMSESYKDVAELLSPSGNATYRFGMCFLFMFDFDRGVKYKLMTDPLPKSLTWEVFSVTILGVKGALEKVGNATPPSQNQALPVATSQQKESQEEQTETKAEAIQEIDAAAGQEEAEAAGVGYVSLTGPETIDSMVEKMKELSTFVERRLNGGLEVSTYIYEVRAKLKRMHELANEIILRMEAKP